MTQFILSTFLLLTVTVNGFARSDERFSFGTAVFFGGRYDNMRMCIATPAGTKGGPFADVQVTMAYRLNEHSRIGVTLPAMRPVLFGLAFKMLQFEPEITFRYSARTASGGPAFTLESGLGAGLHYGPDYLTAKNDASPDRFFAAGPLFSITPGIGWSNRASLRRTAGIKLFYLPLFAHGRKPGTVLGAAVEGQWDFGWRQ